MSHKFFKPVKKFVSRKTALERLNVTETQFNRLMVLCNVYPVVADSKNCYDRVEGWYYLIDDIKKIFYSETYEILNSNLEKSIKREKLMKVEQKERAEKLKDSEFNFVELVKQKYESLGHSIEDLGNSLRHLYLIKMLEIDEVEKELIDFENFVLSRRLLNKAFLSKKGIYFAFDIEKIMIVWMVPYPGHNLTDFIEEKQDPKIVKPTYEFDFLDFGSFEDSESNEIVEYENPNSDDKFDIALLKYSSPLLKIHLKLVLHKLSILLGDSKSSKTVIFSNHKFHVDMKNLNQWISFVILSCNGEISSKEEAEYIVTEIVDVIEPNKHYVQPQFIFDCLNQNILLSPELYLVGMNLPPHISPFPNVLDTIDERSLKLLSNKKKYSIIDRVENLN